MVNHITNYISSRWYQNHSNQQSIYTRV